MNNIELIESKKNNSSWWLWPHKLGFYFMLPIFFMILFNQKKSIDISGHIIFAIYFLTFFLGGYFGSFHKPKLQQKRVSNVLIVVFLLLIIMSYFIWFRDGLSYASLIIKGEMTSIRGEVTTVKGLTTMSQFSIPIFVLLGMRFAKGETLSLGIKILVLFVILFTLFRVIAWNERLAIIELSVSFFVPILILRRQNFNRSLMRWGPFYGLILALFLFAISEYFRSWTYYKNSYDNYAYFILERFNFYYSTSFDNGLGLLRLTDWPVYTFQSSLSGIGAIGGLNSVYNLNDHLDRFANAEFNVFTGVILPIWDMGPLAYVYVFIVGYFGSMGFKEISKGRESFLAMIFPLIFVYSAEILRIFYSLGDGRALMAIFGAFIISLFSLRIKNTYQ